MQALARKHLAKLVLEGRGRLPAPRVDSDAVNVIHVRRSRRHGWGATCECGQSERFPHPDDAWTWTTHHRCLPGDA